MVRYGCGIGAWSVHVLTAPLLQSAELSCQMLPGVYHSASFWSLVFPTMLLPAGLQTVAILCIVTVFAFTGILHLALHKHFLSFFCIFFHKFFYVVPAVLGKWLHASAMHRSMYTQFTFLPPNLFSTMRIRNGYKMKSMRFDYTSIWVFGCIKLEFWILIVFCSF